MAQFDHQMLLRPILGQVIRSKWVENYTGRWLSRPWGEGYQRLVSFDREVCPRIPARLLIPVRQASGDVS